MRLSLSIATIVCVALSGPALAQDKSADVSAAVAKAFEAQYATYCDTLMMDDVTYEQITTPISFKYTNEGATKDVINWQLHAFTCQRGAYNNGSVFYTATEWGEIRPLQFVFPRIETTYADPDDIESAVQSVELTGYIAKDLLFFPEVATRKDGTHTISHRINWRGAGDASSEGVWALENGEFVLKAFWVDASYDGEYETEQVYPQK